MLNILDSLSLYKERIDTACLDVDGMLDKIVSKSDYISYITDVSANNPLIFKDLEIDNPETLMAAIGEALYYCFNGVTITSAQGDVWPLTISTSSNYLAGTIYRGQGNQIGYWEYNNNIESYVFAFDASSGGFDNFGDFIENIAASSATQKVLSIAASLALQGELTRSNFCSSVQNILMSADGNVKTLCTYISDTISGDGSVAQASSLMNCLKNLFGDIPNAVVTSDTKLTFNQTDFFISTSVLLPIQIVASAAASVFSLAMSIITPVLGIVAAGLSTAVSKIVDAVKENKETHWKLLSQGERDNDSFCVPIMQTTRSTAYLDENGFIKQAIIDHGYVKLTNGIYTIYIWPTDSVSSTNFEVNIEMFMNASCDVFYNSPDVSDGLEHVLSELMSWSGGSTPLHPIVSRSGCDTAAFVSNVTTWLDDNATPGGDAPKFEHLSFNDEFSIDGMCRRRFLMSYLLTVYLYCCLTDSNSIQLPSSMSTSMNEYDRSYHLEHYTNIQSAMHCAYQICYEQSLGLVKNDYPYCYNSTFKDILANTVNIGIPCIRACLNSLTNSQIYEFFNLFNIMTPDAVQISDSLLYKGAKSTFIMTHHCCNKANSYAYPPNTTVALWMQLALSSLVITAIAVSTALVTNRIKRAIAFKANGKRLEIAKLKQHADETGTYADWKKAYVANKRYNRFYGRLTGYNYDMNNSWLDIRSSSSDAIDNIAAVARNSDLGYTSLTCECPTVEKLIKG